MSLPRIGITLGDPGGIGPEVVLKSLSDRTRVPAAEYVVFGSLAILEDAERLIGLRLDRTKLTIRDIPYPRRAAKKGAPDKDNGAASFRYFRAAVESARTGDLTAIVTAPVSKLSWGLAGISWRGHTDYLEQFYPDAVMTFWSEAMKVALLSHHRPLKEAIALVTRRNCARFFRVLRVGVEKIRPGTFEFLVAGLNPHAGEDGLLGNEEKEALIPAVDEARASGMKISGPYPPDVVFRGALGHPERIVVALYHDQGLIPFKMAAFESGVNATLGLPFVRTSPDHGTAFDIAGKNQADPESLREAIRWAGELSPGVF
ncbi:MAG: 4-hydroxythreonine-4-phosphate dehydrogenase PdxA [Candidatus Aminicenantes bacterium]|nr:4-hydroxythreonine-4-phosphate dehydrogenase PdxA [Candidatus Aminicenantes bacterium]